MEFLAVTLLLRLGGFGGGISDASSLSTLSLFTVPIIVKVENHDLNFIFYWGT